MATIVRMTAQTRSPQALATYLVDQDYLSQNGYDRLQQCYSQQQRRETSLGVANHKKVLGQFLLSLTPKEAQKLASALVTDWVKWQQHFLAAGETTPKPQSKNISPEQRPVQQQFKQTAGYETQSDRCSPIKEPGSGHPESVRLSQQVPPLEQKPSDDHNASEQISTARRSRKDRNDAGNRSSMEGLSHINKMSEAAPSEMTEGQSRSHPPSINCYSQQQAVPSSPDAKGPFAVAAGAGSRPRAYVHRIVEDADQENARQKSAEPRDEAYQLTGTAGYSETRRNEIKLIVGSQQSPSHQRAQSHDSKGSECCELGSAPRTAEPELRSRNSTTSAGEPVVSPVHKPRVQHAEAVNPVGNAQIYAQLDIAESYGPVNAITPCSDGLAKKADQRAVTAKASRGLERRSVRRSSQQRKPSNTLINRYGTKSESTFNVMERASKPSSTKLATADLPAGAKQTKAPTVGKIRRADVTRPPASSSVKKISANTTQSGAADVAGIAIISKHEQAMKRYTENTRTGVPPSHKHAPPSSEYYSKKKVKPDWRTSTRSPSTVSNKISLLNEPEGFKGSFTSAPEAGKEKAEPFHSTQSFKQLTRQTYQLQREEPRGSTASLQGGKRIQVKVHLSPDNSKSMQMATLTSEFHAAPSNDYGKKESRAFKLYKEQTREAMASAAGFSSQSASRPSFATLQSENRHKITQLDQEKFATEQPPQPEKTAPQRSPSMAKQGRPGSTKAQNSMFKIQIDKVNQFAAQELHTQSERAPLNSHVMGRNYGRASDLQPTLSRDATAPCATSSTAPRRAEQRTSSKKKSRKGGTMQVRKSLEDLKKKDQPALYELSYLDGLKKIRQDENESDRCSSAIKTPLHYELREVSDELLVLEPTPQASKDKPTASDFTLNATTAAALKTVKHPVPSKKTSGSKHFELQRALKAQADKRAAEKRKTAMATHSITDFNARQEASIKRRQELLTKLASQNEAELSEECSFSPGQNHKVQLLKQRETELKKELEEIKATKRAMKMEMPVLNLHSKSTPATGSPTVGKERPPSNISKKSVAAEKSEERVRYATAAASVVKKSETQPNKDLKKLLKKEEEAPPRHHLIQVKSLKTTTVGSGDAADKRAIQDKANLRFNNKSSLVADSLSMPVRLQKNAAKPSSGGDLSARRHHAARK